MSCKPLSLEEKRIQDKLVLRDMSQQLLRMSDKLDKFYEINKDEILKINSAIVEAAVRLEGIAK